MSVMAIFRQVSSASGCRDHYNPAPGISDSIFNGVMCDHIHLTSSDLLP
jgi:hypothetical protein